MTVLAGTAQVDTRIFRSRVEALASDDLPALIVEPVMDVPSPASNPRVQWDLTFHVTAIARGDNPDQSADDIVKDIYSKVMADRSIGGIAMDIFPASTDYKFIEGDKPRVLIIMQFKATYQTRDNDLTTV